MASKPNAYDVWSQIQQQGLQALHGVTFCSGEESYFIKKVESLALSAVEEGAEDFNVDKVYGSDATIEQILGLAKQFPMMSERRVVLVREAMSLKGLTSTDGQNLLLRYVEQPLASTLLLFVDTKGLDKRTNLAKECAKYPNVNLYTFESLQPAQASRWLQQLARDTYDVILDPTASQEFIEWVGVDCTMLDSELQKIATHANQGQTVDRTALRTLLSKTRELSSFELKDAIIARDIPKSHQVIQRMKQTDETLIGESLRMIGMLSNTFTLFWVILRGRQKGLSGQEIQNQCNVNPYYYKVLDRQVNAYQLAEIPGIMEALLDADRALKGFDAGAPHDVLQDVVTRIHQPIK
jgi:DNA polymerase-3 subunit delta